MLTTAPSRMARPVAEPSPGGIGNACVRHPDPPAFAAMDARDVDESPSTPGRRIPRLARAISRTARSAMASKTGCDSVGELADDAQNLGGRGLLLERLLASR